MITTKHQYLNTPPPPNCPLIAKTTHEFATGKRYGTIGGVT
jgi:hypothetical protein